MSEVFVCPKCMKQLNMTDRTAKCESGHCFDRAKEGYFNLLLGQNGGTHGDNKQMILARRNFLDLGYYASLADAVTEAVLAVMPEDGTLLDCGAGECYYTDRTEKALTAACRHAEVYAFDISKDAVILASKRNKNIRLAVAGAYHMPVADGSVDVALNMFAPFAGEEYLRVLKAGGALVMAIPEREHLFGLKSVLYDKPYKNEVADFAIPGITLTANRELRYTVTLESQAAVGALFAMTPYAYRTGSEGRERIAKLDRLTTELHFRVLTYKKKGNADEE
ncbi:MAG: methyltransferase domain-containing protein [Clostridia bacterium]|nr:methyltransferase domain-containing protein [Clostridia bacterium]